MVIYVFQTFLQERSLFGGNFLSRCLAPSVYYNIDGVGDGQYGYGWEVEEMPWMGGGRYGWSGGYGEVVDMGMEGNGWW